MSNTLLIASLTVNWFTGATLTVSQVYFDVQNLDYLLDLTY